MLQLVCVTYHLGKERAEISGFCWMFRAGRHSPSAVALAMVLSAGSRDRAAQSRVWKAWNPYTGAQEKSQVLLDEKEKGTGVSSREAENIKIATFYFPCKDGTAARKSSRDCENFVKLLYNWL